MKKLMLGLSVAMAIVFLSGCTNGIDMKSVHNEPHFAGVVLEVFDGSILVNVNEGEAIRNSSDLIFVSLDVYLADSMTDFMSGDEVVVFFDGTIMETYPAQVNTVFAIILTSPSKASVWHSTINMKISRTKDSHTTAWAFSERSRIDEFLNWFTRLTLARISLQDSEILNIEAFAEVYEFAMSTSAHFSWDEENEFTALDDGDIFVFHYGRIGGAWYLLFGDVWYEVKNPNNIIFPVKHEPVIFQPVEFPEPQHETALPFTLDEWYGGADTAMELIYEDDSYRYYLTSIRSHLIMLTFEDGNRLTLDDAIAQSKVSIEDLKLSGLDMVTVSKNDSTERAINREWAHSNSQVMSAPEGITMSISSYTPSGLSLYFENSTEKTFTNSEAFVLYTFLNNEWERVEPTIDGLWAFHLLGHSIFPNSTTDERTIDWVWLFGELPSGDYKFQTDVLYVRQPGDFDRFVFESKFTLP